MTAQSTVYDTFAAEIARKDRAMCHNQNPRQMAKIPACSVCGTWGARKRK
jgi:hypothetical protein